MDTPYDLRISNGYHRCILGGASGGLAQMQTLLYLLVLYLQLLAFHLQVVHTMEVAF